MAALTNEELGEALAAYDTAVGPQKAGPALPVRMRGILAAFDAVEALRREKLQAELRPVARCQAVREGDEMACGRCGLRWSAGDEDPPSCSPVERRASLRRGGDR